MTTPLLTTELEKLDAEPDETAPGVILHRAIVAYRNAHGLRAKLRRASQPGDPEREARIQAALDEMLLISARLRSLQARFQWESTLLTEGQARTMRLVAKGMRLERTQLQKMRRKA